MAISIKNWFKLAVSVSFIFILVKYSLLNFDLLRKIFINPVVVASLVGLLAVNVLFSSWRWYCINNAMSLRFSYWDTFLSTYVGLAYNNILPGSVSGDFVRIAHLFKRLPNQKAAGAISVLADRIIGLLSVLLLISIIALFYGDLFSKSLFLKFTRSICIGISITAFMLLLIMLVLPEKITTNTRLKKYRIVNEIVASIAIYKKSPAVLILCIFISLIIQCIIISMIALIGHVFLFSDIQFIYYMIAGTTTQIANLMPISPGGVGVGEAAFANILISFINNNIAPYATIYLAYRLINMFLCAPALLVKMRKAALAERKGKDIAC